MKINLIHKKLSKRFLLALATFSFATAAYSANYYDDNTPGPHNGVIDSNGSIIQGEFAYGMLSYMTFTNSNLSNYSVELHSGGNNYIELNLTNNTTLLADSLYVHNESDSHEFIVLNVTDNSVFRTLSFAVNEGYGRDLKINVDGNSILNLGKGNGVSEINLTNNSTWEVIGNTYVGFLNIHSGSNIDFVMTSATDKITAMYGNTTGMDSINISFSNDFLAEIGTGEFIFDALDTIVGFWSPIYTLSDNNGTYIWDNTYLGGETGYLCKIDNIRLIPEPSTYAAIFGVLALGLAIYRRRK